MSLQRSFNWSAALRSLNADRIQVAPGVRTARSLIDGMARIRRTTLVTPNGAFDRAAIMAELALDIVDRIIAILDEGDGDPDREDGGDAEPGLGAPKGHESQVVWLRGGDDDREAD